jgi:hypothetical protein
MKKSITSEKSLKSMLDKADNFVCIYWVDDHLHLTKKNDNDDILLISLFLAHDDDLTMKIFSEIQELKKM